MMMKRSSETVSVGLVTLAERTFEKRGDVALRSHLQRVMVAEYIDVVTLGHGCFEKSAIDTHRFRAWILGVRDVSPRRQTCDEIRSFQPAGEVGNRGLDGLDGPWLVCAHPRLGELRPQRQFAIRSDLQPSQFR